MSIIEKAVDKLDVGSEFTDLKKNTLGAIRSRRGALGKKIKSTLDLDQEVQPSIAVDFARLDKYGLYFSNDVSKQSGDELRRIKRIMLKLAFSPRADASTYPSNVFMITSALPNEGKSYMSTNLAMSIANERSVGVVLVDADIPKRQLSHGFGIDKRQGLVDILNRNKGVTFSDIVLHTDVSHLALISAGISTQTDPEVFTDFFAEGFFRELSTQYPDRIILIDTSPLLLTSHAASLAQHMGQIVVVVESGNTENKYISEALEMLDKNKSIGFIMNKAAGKGYSKYYREYGDYSTRDNAENS